MRIAILTEQKRLKYPGVDESLLKIALEERGAHVDLKPWDEPNADWSAFDLAVIRTTWDYFERIDEYLPTLKKISQSTRLLNPYELVEWNSNKNYLQDLAQKGAEIIPTLFLKNSITEEVLQNAFPQFHTQKLVVKPAVSASGFNTFLIEQNALDAYCRGLDQLTLIKEWLIQPLMPAIQNEGEFSFIFFANGFSHATRKVAASGEFRVHEERGGRILPHSPSANDLKTAQKIIEKIPGGEWLYARVDMVRDLVTQELRLMELELIEPSLYWPAAPGAEHRLAQCLIKYLS